MTLAVIVVPPTVMFPPLKAYFVAVRAMGLIKFTLFILFICSTLNIMNL
jgi:hypothetical protein